MVRNGPIAYQDSRLSKGKKKKEATIRFRSGTYFTTWKGKEHRFSEPIPYDFTLPIEFPNITLRAKDLREAKAKVETINSKAIGTDRFDFDRKGVLWIQSREKEPTCSSFNLFLF